MRLMKWAPVCLMLLLSSCAGFKAEITPQDFPVHGIDISRYQGNIDWQEARRGNVAFAWIKATEGGDYADPMFLQHWMAASAAGVPRGAYHFYYFCRTAEEQARWFMENVPVDPSALPPVLDMEWNGHSKTCRRQPSKEHIWMEMAKFLAIIERHYGKKPVIYTTVDFHEQILDGKFDSYPFWIRSVAAPPHVRYPTRRWTFWQYTAEGRVPGIKGNVDRNAFAGDRNDWYAFVNGPQS